MRVEQRSAERGEPVQRRGDRASGFPGTRIVQLLRLAPGAADDAVVRLDYRIGGRGSPFDDTDRKDGAAPIGVQVAQAIGEIAFALPTQTSDAVRRDTGEQVSAEVHRAEKLQPVEQPVRRGGIVARLDPAQPDEAADRTRQHLGRQPVKPGAGDAIEPRGDPLLYTGVGTQNGPRYTLS